MTLRLASTALRATAGKSLAQGWVRRIVVVAWTVGFATILGGTPLLACPMCFGAEETGMVQGTKVGVFVMLGITLVVQGGFLAFFLYLRKHAKRNADIELDTEWSELQRLPRRS